MPFDKISMRAQFLWKARLKLNAVWYHSTGTINWRKFTFFAENVRRSMLYEGTFFTVFFKGSGRCNFQTSSLRWVLRDRNISRSNRVVKKLVMNTFLDVVKLKCANMKGCNLFCYAMFRNFVWTLLFNYI